MAKPCVTIYGGKELVSKLDLLSEEKLNKMLSPIVLEMAEKCAELAKANLKSNGSYRTGRLYNSIKARLGKPKGKGRIVAVTYAETVKDGKKKLHNYSMHVEYGTRKMQAKPYMRPAGNDPAIRQNAVNRLLKEIKKVFGND